VDGSIILAVLAVFGVAAIVLWSLKGFVQQLQDLFEAMPAFFASFHRARKALRDEQHPQVRSSAGAEPPEQRSDAA
jgi:predicted PurR-regulated permease PerM